MKKSATPASLRDLCLTHFKILGIPIAPNDLDTMLERADKETLSHLMFLDLLLGQQAAARRERSVEYVFAKPDSKNAKHWRPLTGSSIRRSIGCKWKNSPAATSYAGNRISSSSAKPASGRVT